MTIFPRILPVIVLLSSGLPVFAQLSRSDTVKLLCRTWKINQLDQEPVDRELREDWREMIRDSRTTFKADGTVIESNGEISENAKWNLSTSGKEIKFVYKDGEQRVWIIVSLSSSFFRFREEDPETGQHISGTLTPLKK